ncbi:MAG: choice-of-anchor J domain-containing protein [Bacteroidales bacterium]|nr:choice-of-anchor J domain-containing protein [Bacteroidales bacterium]
MRKSIWTMSAVALVALLAGSCAVKSDLDALTARVETVESRVDDLEAIVNNLNKTVVPGLQTLVTALDKKLTVTSVVAAEDGKSYTINFSDGTTAVISSIKGDPGVSPDAPVIGTKAEGGVLYWTVNGEFLKDAQGNKIPVTGPQGPAGNDGNDGSDGEDGHTPVLGVKADTDGILYWTVDGEFLKDANGNKVPATGSQGEPGSDGKTVGTTEIGGILYWTVDGEVLKDGQGNPIPVRGQDGVNGTTPTVSIELVGGVWVWVINGEVVKDENGDPIPVTGATGEDGSDGTNGITPQFKIMDGAWYVSYDNGATFERVGLVADTGTTVFVDADSDPDNVILTINTHEVLIPKEKAFALIVTIGPDNGVAVGESADFAYTIQGAGAGDEVDVDIIGIIGGWEAVVVPTDNASGVITVTNVSNGNAKITVYAANHKGKTDIRTLVFEGGVLEAVIATQDIPATGGQLPLTITANQAYEIVIPVEAQSWISVIDTRAHVDELAVVVEPNTTGAYRSATVSVVNSATGDVVKDIEIFQYPNPDVTTSIASVVALDDDTSASLFNITAIAANDAQAIVTDGTDKLLVNAAGLYNGVFSLTGKKNTSALGQPYMDVTAVSFDMSATPIPVVAFDDYTYYGFGANGFFNFYTVNAGEVSKDGDLFVISTPATGTVDQNTGETILQRFVIDGPDAALGLDALVGKTVSVKGWVPNVDADDASGKEDINLIPTEVKEITFQKEAGWAASYLGAVASGQYPEVIQFSVANPDENDRFLVSVYPADQVDAQVSSVEEFVEAQAISAVDDFLFYLTYYSMSYGYTPAELVDILSYYDNEDYETYEAFPYGRYYVVLYGVDSEGAITGKYAVGEFSKKLDIPDPVNVPYEEDFESGDGGWMFFDLDGDGFNWQHSATLAAHSGSGLLFSQSYANGTGALTPDNIAVTPPVILTADNYLNFWITAQDDDYCAEHYAVYVTEELPTAALLTDAAKIFEETISETGYHKKSIAIPAAFNGKTVFISFRHFNCTDMFYLNLDDVSVAEAAPEDPVYESFLGTWIVPTETGKSVWKIEEGQYGQTFAISGIGGLRVNGAHSQFSAQGLYDSASGTMSIGVQKISADYEYTSGSTGYDILSCLYNNGANLTSTIGTVVATAAVEGGSLVLTPATINTGSGEVTIESITMFSNQGGWYLLGESTPLPNSGSRPTAASAAYSKWLGTWTVPAGAYNRSGTYTIAEEVPNVSYVMGLFYPGISSSVAYPEFDEASGNILFRYKETGGLVSNGTNTFSLYMSGLTNTSYVAMGDPSKGRLMATLVMSADGQSAEIVPAVYDSNGNETFAVSIGLMGRNLSTNGWSNFGMLISTQVEGVNVVLTKSGSAGAPAVSAADVSAVGRLNESGKAVAAQRLTNGGKLNVTVANPVQKGSAVKRLAKASSKPAPAKPAANVPARRSAQKIQSIPAASKLAK